MSALGKWMILAGAVLAALGLLVWLGGKAGLPFGSLPGDIRIRRDRFSLYLPIVTCIVLSVLLTVVLNVLIRLFRK
ncbi:MAG: DUF2905 domain-containing protein [Candidatus Brocadiia bacterium]